MDQWWNFQRNLVKKKVLSDHRKKKEKYCMGIYINHGSIKLVWPCHFFFTEMYVPRQEC
jgi:hypothetical protein